MDLPTLYPGFPHFSTLKTTFFHPGHPLRSAPPDNKTAERKDSNLNFIKKDLNFIYIHLDFI